MAKAEATKAMEKMMMTMIQIMGTGIVMDLFDNSKFKDENMGVNGLGVVCVVEMVASDDVRVVVVERY
jgi:hypothetical protein